MRDCRQDQRLGVLDTTLQHSELTLLLLQLQQLLVVVVVVVVVVVQLLQLQSGR